MREGKTRERQREDNRGILSDTQSRAKTGRARKRHRPRDIERRINTDDSIHR